MKIIDSYKVKPVYFRDKKNTSSEISQISNQDNTKRKKINNYYYAGAAVAALIIGGILYKKQTYKIDAELAKLQKEAEEKVKAERNKLEQELKTKLKNEQEFFSTYDKEFEDIMKGINENYQSHSFYDWDAEFKRNQEEFDKWFEDFNRKNKEFWEENDKFWKEYWEKEAERKKSNKEFWEKFNQEFNNTFQNSKDRANQANKKTNTSYQNTLRANYTSNRATDTFSDDEIKEIDELFKTKVSAGMLQSKKETLALLLKASVEDVQKIIDKDKKTYRQYVLKLHPDKNPDDKLATFRFVILDKIFKN